MADTGTTAQPESVALEGAEQENNKSVFEFAREAWSQALVAVNAAEEEVQKIVSRVSGWVEMKPEEARRLGVELSDKLRAERNQVEAGLESAVHRALTPFRLPSRDDLAGLHARVSILEARIDRLVARRARSSRSA
jgi:polyhydroxyalkanoate synthesis regulator phasin